MKKELLQETTHFLLLCGSSFFFAKREKTDMEKKSWNQEDILYEDDQILVCRKHAGMAVQSARIGQMDMESALKNYRNGDFVGVVQRLDQPVEGVLVFGKTPLATAELNRQHQNGKMKKKYLAVYTKNPVKGNTDEKEEHRNFNEEKENTACLEDILLKDGKTNTSRVVKKGTPQGKQAILFYQVIEEEKDTGLAEVTLKTGRHHQIRVQMAYHGMPLWGDGKYNSHIREEERGTAIGLCAYKLEFFHPKTGKKLQFQIKPEGEVFEKFKKLAV